MWSPDTELDNADWLRTVVWKYPTRAGAFLDAIAGPGATRQQQHRALAFFSTLPARRAMPIALERALKTQGFEL